MTFIICSYTLPVLLFGGNGSLPTTLNKKTKIMETTIIQKAWTKSKLLIKALIIGLIVLLLQLPVYYIQGLIEEREQRQKQAITEVNDKWAGPQNIIGPIIGLPYRQRDGDSTSGISTKHIAWYLPDELTVKATATPQRRHRGIYEVMLYTSSFTMNGNFSSIDLQKLNLLPQNIVWNEAFVKVNISDAKGLNDEFKLKWNDKELTLSPQTYDSKAGTDGLYASLGINSAEELQNIHFATTTNISGSGQLLFTPIGKTTSVRVSSSWPHPSFTGNTLPQDSNVKDSGFTATWKSLAYKRSFPQQWKDDAFFAGNTTGPDSASGRNISTSSFGADLFIPVNGYQKTMRSVKYSFLCILLTFAAFFLIETTSKKAVHPFQYGLIGLALVLFYTLLLSLSEYIGFDPAYLISAVATIGLIAPFVRSVISSSRLATILSVVLVLIYGYVFTILQLQDYSLLLGSIGLFITLGIIMYFSRKLQW
jgi:inner membrane protein